MLLLFDNVLDKKALSYEHTKRQVAVSASAAEARSHWDALWCSKIGPRPIPNRHPKRQNFKAAAAAGCAYILNPFKREF